MLLSFIIFLLAYLGFALTRNVVMIAVLFIFYGLYQGIFRTVGKAFATDFVPGHLRASGVGWYNTAVGVAGLVASIVAGLLWDHIGHSAVFLYGAAFAGVGCIALAVFDSCEKAQIEKPSPAVLSPKGFVYVISIDVLCE